MNRTGKSDETSPSRWFWCVRRPARGSEEMRLVTIICATATLAACANPGSDYAGVAAELDQARAEIAPPLGATTYTLDSSRLRDQPGDENRSLAQSLLQLPGVSL